VANLQCESGSFFLSQRDEEFVRILHRAGTKKLSEHPAPPTHPDAASIWLTPWIRLLRTHPEVALHVVAQWKWGCTVSKPTGLLAVRLPFFGRSMHSRQQEQAIAPKRPDSKAKVSKPFS